MSHVSDLADQMAQGISRHAVLRLMADAHGAGLCAERRLDARLSVHAHGTAGTRVVFGIILDRLVAAIADARRTKFQVLQRRLVRRTTTTHHLFLLPKDADYLSEPVTD